MKVWHWLALGTCLLSLALNLSWGPYLDDAVYLTFKEVRAWTAVTWPPPFWTSPIYFVILWLWAQLGVSLWWISLVIGGLCWGGMVVFAVRLLDVSRSVAMVTAVFIALSPALLLTAGTHTALYMLAAFLALFLTRRQAWRAQTLTLLLLPLLHFDLSTLALLLLLLWLRWCANNLFPGQVALLLLAAYGTWGIMSWPALGLSGLLTFPPPFAETLSAMGELYWLLTPLMLFGILALRSRPILQVVVIWTAVSFLSSGDVVIAITAVTGWLLAGRGLNHLMNLLPTGDDQARSPVLLAITLPLFILSLVTLGQRYSTRPVVRFDLENQVSAWLQANSGSEATLMAPAHIHSLIKRPGPAWQEETAGQLEPLLSTIQTVTPDYLVTARTIPFDQVRRAAWFQEHYAPLQQFASPYESTAPLTIWGYRPTLFGLGEGRPLNVQTDHNIAVVGYQYEPTRLQPGEDIRLTLFLQATVPVTTPLNAWLRLTAFDDNQEWVREIRPIATDWTEGTVVSQIVTATVPVDIPVGAYRLTFSLQAQGEENVLALYRNNDANMLDRVVLGNVIVPGAAISVATVPVNVRFGEQITLLSYALEVQQDTLAVDLFWQATQPPAANYVVFVHLLSDNGQLVASQDGPPLDGRFPTTAWLPDDIIPDRHIVILDEGTTGNHQLNVGLYLPGTGERLPAWHSDGTPVPDGSLTLQIVEIE